MDAALEKRIRDFVEIVDQQLGLCDISLRKYENERRCLERMINGQQVCSPENLYNVGRGVWSLVTEKTTKEGRQDNIHAFWRALVTELHRCFPRAITPEQWAVLHRLPDHPQFDAWKAFLDRWVLPRTPLGLPPEVTAALAPYRQRVVENFHEISLSGFGGLGAQSEGEGKAELSKVYIDLDTKAEAKPDALSRSEEGAPRRPKSAAVPALERLARDRCLVLIGLPGSGKSTLLRFFSLCLAQCGLKPDAEWLEYLRLWPKWETDLIPVFVELRQFAASVPLPLPAVDGGQHLTNYILAQLKPAPLEECAPALKMALTAGRAIVFLDGLDEVPDDDKLHRFVLDTVAGFARGPFQASRIVVTCRPRSYDDPAWQLEGFEKAELAALDAAKIERFIGRFYDEVARHDRKVADVKADRIAKLKLAVRREELQELASNPFMLTVMAWLHRFEELPRKRALILDRLVEQLLFKWEEAKRRDDGTQPQKLSELLKRHDLEVRSLRRVLCRLAFQARQTGEPTQSGQPAGFAVSIAKSRLLSEFAELPPRDKVAKDHREQWALQVIQVIDRRTGLLVPGGGDSFTMPYKLQEFLSGEHLTDRDELKPLAEALKLPAGQCEFGRVVARLIGENGYWEEVVKWAAAIQAHVKYNKGEARDLAFGLCEVKAPSEAAALRRAVVAEEILWEVGVNEVANTLHGPECLKRVRETLDGFMRRESLAPKQRASAGAARGWLEDLPKGVGLTQDRLPDIEWIKIPSGKFIMGGEADWEGGKQFQCGLIKAPYRISRYPVTVAQFQTFVDDKGYEQEEFWNWSKDATDWFKGTQTKRRDENENPGPKDYDPVFQTPNHPRVGVSWFEAVAFCRWLSQKLSEKNGLPQNSIRLPSEAEWERAARGAKGRAWPWKGGESDLGRRCNCDQSGIGHTSAVGLFPSGDTPPEKGNTQGVAELAGNVWQWCRTEWLEDYQNYEDKVCDELEGHSARVVRGGSWVENDPRSLSPSYRLNDVPGGRDGRIGFRLVWLSVSVSGG